MLCAHCKGEVGSRMVIMANDIICCYTCGRLRADQKCRVPRVDNSVGQEAYTHFVETLELLERRRDLRAV